MTRVERWMMSISSGVVALSGLLYLWMKYLLKPEDPFAVVNHPWQPYVLDVHVLAAPALMIVFGAVWSSHARSKISAGQHHSRLTGLVSLWSFIVMAGTGYVLQVLTSETGRQAAVVLHATSGGAFLLAYAFHVVASLRRARQRDQLRSAA